MEEMQDLLDLAGEGIRALSKHQHALVSSSIGARPR
jgi:hypothetical protein